MKNGLILLLILSTTVFSSVTLSESKSKLVSEATLVPEAKGGLTLLKAQIPARNEIRQIKGTRFLGMQDLDGDGWRDDSPTPEHVLVTRDSFPECNIPFDAYCHTTGRAFTAWVGGAYSQDEHKLRIPAGGGHADGGSNAVYALNLETLMPSRETNPSPLDGPLMVDRNKDGIKDSCPYPSDGPPASHTYDGVVDIGDKVFLTGWVGYCRNAMSNKVGFWLYDKATREWEQVADYKESASATRTGYDKLRNVIYFLDNKGFHEFDLTSRKSKHIRRNPEWYSDGRGSGYFDEKNRIFYYTADDLWAIPMDDQGVSGKAQKLSSEFKGHFVQNKETDVLWSWDCGTDIRSYDPATGVAVQHNPAGVKPLNLAHRVYSKHFTIDELGILACIDDPKNGLYIYNPPNGPFEGEAQVIPVVNSTVPEELVYHETFETTDWYKNWLARSTKTDTKWLSAEKVSNFSLETDCVVGNCTKVKVKQFSCCGASIYYKIPGELENVTLEYYLKLAPNWSPKLYDANGYTGKAGGKLPGLADNRVWPDPQCGNGGSQSDGINCWSMRAMFKDCSGASCGNKTRFGGYLYHPQARDFWGEFVAFDDEKATISGGIGKGGQLENDRWYHVKMQVAMNTPGRKNGVIRGWVDGELSFERKDMILRREGHDNLHVRNVWFNVYFGGQKAGPPEETYVLVDELIIKGK